MVCLGAISLLCVPKHQFFILTAKKNQLKIRE